MSDSLNIEKEEPIDYAQCYRKAREGYENLFMEICELYLLSRALCEFAEELFDYSVCYEILLRRCMALLSDADTFLAELTENCFEK